MVATDKEFAGSIPEIYDRLLVPLIFEPYAADLAERVAARQPREVLEIAAGTGALTRALASRLPPNAHVVATDLNPPMLEQAARRLQDPRIEWSQADAMVLPFEDQRFEAVACQFGAMFFPDKGQAYREAYRVLKPGGRLFLSVWDALEVNEIADVVTRALAEVFPDDPPRFLARTPHGYHDKVQISAELRAAGFVDVSVEVVEARSRAPSPRGPAVAFCQGTPLRNEIEARDPSGLEAATQRAGDALAKRFGSGPIDGRIQALVFTAIR
ncbi:class I SAM-dependent methyltransferase [Salinarimonas soli]|uniref:Class I SAM-dependent methyltransferase n=1 Tax=Salinarimonas soli TaxID=1638099 RepID=A0A5B2V5J2_9HYPH|nr:class I SAM-dependent methyltransferase [Salinarimonas soli]KAA2234176.1 class I SAM-dependent methyltransferase [Salinarimonas soli]